MTDSLPIAADDLLLDSLDSGVGRPSDYTADIARAILARIAEGETLLQICRDDGMPNRRTVTRWCLKNEPFRLAMLRARELQMEAFGDEIVEISDDSTCDTVTKTGRNGAKYEAVDHEHINRSKLRVETRWKLMQTVGASVFGARSTVKHEGEMTVKHELSDRERARRLAFLLAEGGVTLDGTAIDVTPTSESDTDTA